jgi:hypothetical protein
MQTLLIENLSPNQAKMIESVDDQKNYYLSGIMMQADLKNGNGRVYPLSEISRCVEEVAKKISEGFPILGELNHPDNLSINLQNVSHAITEIKMDGQNAVGKMKLLNTPAGNIARAIMEGGVRLGVSSRGTGNVTNEGHVSDFNFVTIDIVSNPSAPNALPNLVREALENKKVMTLAEAVVHDETAQKYFKKEILNFIQAVRSKAK